MAPDVHRTSGFDGFSSCISNQRKGTRKGCLSFGAGDRTRTCTLTRWNLNPMSLPIPPRPHINSRRDSSAVIYFIGSFAGNQANRKTFTEVTAPKSNGSSCCGARQPLRPAKQACVLPTAATRSARFIRHRRRSHRFPIPPHPHMPLFLHGEVPGAGH